VATKKGQIFRGKKCTPEKILATPMVFIFDTPTEILCCVEYLSTGIITGYLQLLELLEFNWCSWKIFTVM